MAELMTAPQVVVARHSGFLWLKPTWDLSTPHGEVLGTVVRQPGGSLIFGGSIRFVATDAGGNVVWLMNHFATMRISRFVVAGAAGEPIGRVTQENAMFAPQFRLTGADGAEIRLVGGRMGSWTWTLEDIAGGPLGLVVRQQTSLTDMFVKEHTYLVERGDGLGGGLWPLAVLSSICLDIVHDRKQDSGG